MLQDQRFALTTAIALMVHGVLLGSSGLVPTSPSAKEVTVDAELEFTLEYSSIDVRKRAGEATVGVERGSTTIHLGSARDSARASANPPDSARASANPPNSARLGDGPGRSMPVTRDSNENVATLEAPSRDDVGAERIQGALAAGNESSHRTTIEPGTPAPMGSSSAASRAGLSLEQLGILQPGAAALPQGSPLLRDAEKRLAHSQTLDRSLRQGASDEGLRLGLGPAGPILSELEARVQSSVLPANGWATVLARLSSSGSLELTLLGSSSDRERWSKLLSEAQRALAGKKLPIPRGSRGVDLQIHVESRVQLPSGADPGISVKLFGVPLKKGEGKRSAAVEILSSLPRYESDEGPKPSGEPAQPRIIWDLGKVIADPSDIGAKRRRMVRAVVTQQTVL